MGCTSQVPHYFRNLLEEGDLGGMSLGSPSGLESNNKIVYLFRRIVLSICFFLSENPFPGRTGLNQLFET